TKKAQKGTNANAHLEYGSFDTKRYGINITHAQERFDIALSANHIDSQGFTTVAPRDEDINRYEDDGYENTTLNIKTNYYINDSSKVGLQLTTIDAKKEYDMKTLPDYSIDPNDDTMESEYESRLYGVEFEHNVYNHTLSFKAQRSDFERVEHGTQPSWFGESVRGFEGTHTNYELSDHFAYLPHSFVQAGIGKAGDAVSYTMTDGFSEDKKDSNSYGYVTNSNRLSDTVLTQSLRYDSYDNFKNKLTGKIGLKQYINEYEIFANYATGYNVPSMMHRLNPWGAANMDINPEDSKSYDVGIGYKGLRVSYFYQEITDLIEWDTDNKQYKNLEGENEIEGFELEYSQEIFADTLLHLNYTRLYAKDDAGKDLARRAKENLKFGVDYYGIESLHLGIYGEYVGKRYDKADKQGQQTGRYTVANFVANYALHENFDLYAKVDNITDKYYQVVDGYATPPRSYYAGIKVNF
ncbi:MAG: TonB-dependent receptor plug domain-containing protein, partial [Campylobacterota bacterium]